MIEGAPCHLVETPPSSSAATKSKDENNSSGSEITINASTGIIGQAGKIDWN